MAQQRRYDENGYLIVEPLNRDWWINEGGRYTHGSQTVPTIALLSWTHERRELHRAPINTCPSCAEYRALYGPAPGPTEISACRDWLKDQRRHEGHARDVTRVELRKRAPVRVYGSLWWEILERDDFRCQHCGVRRFLTVDHIVPVVRGGTNDRSNLQTLCYSCNCSKGGR